MMLVLIEDHVNQFIYIRIARLHLQPNVESLFIEEGEHLLIDIYVATSYIWIIRFTTEAEICALSIQDTHYPDGGWFCIWKFRRHLFANGCPVFRTRVV